MVRAGQQKAVGKPFLRLVTAARAYVFQLATSADVEAVVPVLAPLLGKRDGNADAAQTAAAMPAVSAADSALRKKLLDDNQCACSASVPLFGSGWTVLVPVRLQCIGASCALTS